MHRRVDVQKCGQLVVRSFCVLVGYIVRDAIKRERVHPDQDMKKNDSKSKWVDGRGGAWSLALGPENRLDIGTKPSAISWYEKKST